MLTTVIACFVRRSDEKLPLIYRYDLLIGFEFIFMIVHSLEAKDVIESKIGLRLSLFSVIL